MGPDCPSTAAVGAAIGKSLTLTFFVSFPRGRGKAVHCLLRNNGHNLFIMNEMFSQSKKRMLRCISLPFCSRNKYVISRNSSTLRVDQMPNVSCTRCDIGSVPTCDFNCQLFILQLSRSKKATMCANSKFDALE